jgi:hypothetical protein
MSHTTPTLDRVGDPQQRAKPIARKQAELEHLSIVVIDEAPAHRRRPSRPVMAHGSAAFTLTVYGHLFDADMDALADALDVSDAGRVCDERSSERYAHRRQNLRGCCSGGGTRNPQRTDQQ